MKSLKHIILVLICIFLLNGCVKEHSTMTINKDKSMNVETEILVSDKLLESGLADSTKETIELLEKATDGTDVNGYKVTAKKENGYSGYIITRKYKNIDDISVTNEQTVDLNDASGANLGETEVKNMFKVETGFLKNVYTANFKFKYNESEYTNSSGNYIDDDETETTTETNDENTLLESATDMVPTTEAVATDNSSSSESNGDLMNLAKEFEITYVVNLPYKVISNNASKVSDNGKTLTWNLSSATEEFKIEYSFPIYNLTNIIIVGGGTILLLILIIIIIIKSKKKETTKETLIHTDYDSSIVGQIDEASGPVDNIPQGPTNHEFSLPNEPQVNVTQEQAPETPTMMGPEENIPVMPSASVIPQDNITQSPIIDSGINQDVDINNQ